MVMLKDSASRRALGSAIGLQGELSPLTPASGRAVVESGLACTFVADPEGTATGASETPGIDQVRVGSVGDQVCSFVLRKGQSGKKKKRKAEYR